MKCVINENERGYLLKDGRYQRLLSPGKHSYWPLLGQQILVVSAEGRVDTQGIPVEVLLADGAFAAAVARFQVPDDCIALHYKDGAFEDVLTSPEHLYWNIHHQHTVRLVDISQPEMGGDVPPYLLNFVPKHLHSEVEIPAGWAGLLFFDNRFQRRLTPGIYYFWTYRQKVAVQLLDLRSQQLEINGQEILTADKVGIRLNVSCTYRLTDPEAAANELKNLAAQLYTYGQLTVREYVGQFRLDQLLEQKEQIGQAILERLRAGQEAYYVAFSQAGIKDIILPGAIQEIMNTVLVAEKTAQANVIARREEVASTRSLLNTAKLMDENATLYKLKELEYLEKICDRVGSISLSGGSNVLEQLGSLLGSR